MIRLVRSEDPSSLLDGLAQAVARVRTALGPLEPITLVVPHDAVGHWAQQGLAARLGIVAHLRTPRLRGWLGEVVEATRPGVELAGARALSGALLERLHHIDPLIHPELAPVAAYLNDAPDRRAVANRRVQLAEELGRCFERYVHERPGWVERWRRGPVASSGGPVDPSGGPVDPSGGPVDEPWQAALFRQLVGPGGPFEPREPEPGRPARWLAVDALARLPSRWTLPSPTFLLAVAIHDGVTAQMLARVAADAELTVFEPTVVPRFWEPPEEGPPHPLRGWLRLARQESRTLAELAGWNVDSAAPEISASTLEAPPPSLLAALRAEILGAPPELRRSPDDSVRVVGAPGIRRECEAIADACWRHLEADPRLRLSDIAVVLATPEAETYRVQLAAAFAEADGLPLHELDAPLADDSPVIDATRHLVGLLGSGRTRQDVLRVLTHPAVRSRFGLGEVGAWVRWCEQLGILHGADRRDHRDTYIEKELFHWDQGLRRLALGAWMAPESTVEVTGELRYFPAELDPTETASAGRLTALARSLLADAERIGASRLRLPDWADLLATYVDTYVGAPRSEDERHRSRVLETIASLGTRSTGQTEMDAETAVGLLDPELARLRGHRGPPLAEAVVLGPLHGLARIPFRVVFWPGFGEGCFPRSDRSSSLDLRSVRPSVDDVAPSHVDLHDLVQRIAQTRDAIRFSFVARDPRTAEPLAPAGALGELLEHLERSHLERPIPVEPLSPRWEPGGAASGPAEAERAAAVLGASLRRAGLPTDDLHRALGTLQPDDALELSRRLRLATPPTERAEPPRPRVSLATLRRYLEEPIQGWARQALRLGWEDARPEEVAARVDERFELERHESASLLKQVFLPWVGRGLPIEALETAYESTADRFEASGRLPTGVFGEATRRRHRAELEAWRRGAYEALEGAEPRLTRLELGRPGRPPLAGGRLLAPLELPGAMVVGDTEPGPVGGGSLLFVATVPPREHDRIRLELRAWLAQLVHAALGEARDERWPILIAPSDGGGLARTELEPLSPERARALLSSLCDGVTGAPPLHVFPLSTQLRLHDERNEGAGTRRLEGVLRANRPDRFGPLPLLELEPPPLEAAMAMVAATIEPFLAARRMVG